MKNVIITGTSRGIGLEMVRGLGGNSNYSVLALSRNEQPVKELGFDNVTALSYDLSAENFPRGVVDFVEKKWGSQVDFLIHNAGKMIHKPFEKITAGELEKIYQVNILGVFRLTQKLISMMDTTGHIVMSSTMGAVQGSLKFSGLTAYSSSKAALVNLAEILAEEYKEKGPAVNCLAFGAVQTEMFEEAFPGMEAPVSAEKMADYVLNFMEGGQEFYNGKLLQVSNSTP